MSGPDLCPDLIDFLIYKEKAKNVNVNVNVFNCVAPFSVK